MIQRTFSDWPIVDGKVYISLAQVWVFQAQEFGIALIWAVALTLLRLLCNRVVRAAIKRFGTLRNEATILKFCESVWKVSFYMVSFSWGLSIAIKMNWFPETVNMWLEFPQLTFPDDARIFYLFSLGFYLHSLFVQFWLETRRSDFWEMALHHIVTSSLIAGSWGFGFIPVGILILVLHDASDIVFEVAKICIYLKREMLADCVFGFWVLTWIVFRMWGFPYYILNSTLFEAFQGAVARNIHPDSVSGFFYFFNALLIVLYALHWFWFCMILKLVWSKLTGKTLVDPREADADKDE